MTKQPITPDPNESDLNRRESGRVSPYWLNSDPGYVLDISETGIRLLVKRCLKGRLTLPIWTEQVGLHLPAEVVWTKKIGRRQFEVGLRFLDLNDEDRQRLRALALEHEEKRANSSETEATGPVGAAAEANEPSSSDADDPRLNELIDAWSSLPDAVKAGIIALSDAARGRAA
ncbi:MAG: PilZ domain-containing protein [Planctomycetota bacterium]|jgi:hypothetical protein